MKFSQTKTQTSGFPVFDRFFLTFIRTMNCNLELTSLAFFMTTAVFSFRLTVSESPLDLSSLNCLFVYLGINRGKAIVRLLDGVLLRMHYFRSNLMFRAANIIETRTFASEQ
jgi:hypothetical protein